jgi:hypothetical protein
MSSQATVPSSNSTQQPPTEPPNKDAAPANNEGAKKPVPLWHMALLCVWLFVWMVGLIWQITLGIDAAADEAMAEVSVAWNMPPEVVLNSGPAAFRYDAAQQRLIHHGVITPERRLELRTLLTMRPAATPRRTSDSNTIYGCRRRAVALAGESASVRRGPGCLGRSKDR